MEKRTKFLYIFFFLLIIIVISLSFYKYIIKKDYFIQMETECNPETESCFVYECVPGVDEECPEEEAERKTYYKLITKKAYLMPDCTESEDSCPVITCAGDESCQETLCNSEDLPEGESCSLSEEVN